MQLAQTTPARTTPAQITPAPAIHAPGLLSEPVIGRCTASDVLRWAGLPQLASAESDALPLWQRRVAAEQTLVHEDQSVQALYLVAAGSFKCTQTDLEGYEQVLGFAIHGDMLGLDGMGDLHHSSAAVALEDSTVVVLPYPELLQMSQQLPALNALLHHAAGVELQHRGHTQYLISAASAEVRVARFLLHFAQRQLAQGHSQRRLHLRMTRRDIASCLCVAHETVSRALTALVAQGCIRVCNRDVEITDPALLQSMQRVTRGAPRRKGHTQGTAGTARFALTQ